VLPRVSDIVAALFDLAPESLAESWDNVGLLVGDARAEVSRVVVSLDVTDQVLAQAVRESAELVVAHHPMLLQPLNRFREDETTGRLVAHALRRRLSVCAMHSNLDAAPGGLSGAAVCGAGGGRIGNYADCSFRSPGIGTYRPLEGARPYAGAVGRLESAEELRLEVLVPKGALAEALRAMREAHPYEEVAYDVYPVENTIPGAGIGRVGRLPAPATMAELAARVREALGADQVHAAGARIRSAQTIAVCPGGGGGLVAAAVRAGADALVTGDVKYHHALEAAESGLTVIDAGHGPTERPSVALMVEFLGDRFGDAIELIAAPSEDVWAVI